MKSFMIYHAFEIKFLQLVVWPNFDEFVNTNGVTPTVNISNFPGVFNELTNEIVRFIGDKTLFVTNKTIPWNVYVVIF